ncbi:MAG: hypothetical protein IKA39_03420, partial [Clostridia bacterium]|nr:hypothetical protein [Clostridia bacterium]
VRPSIRRRYTYHTPFTRRPPHAVLTLFTTHRLPHVVDTPITHRPHAVFTLFTRRLPRTCAVIGCSKLLNQQNSPNKHPQTKISNS